MVELGSGHRLHKFIAFRVMALGAMLLLAPVVLWSPLFGMIAVWVAVFWQMTMADRAALLWAQERVGGASNGAAASSAGVPRAFVVLVGAVFMTVVTTAALRYLSPLGTWLTAPGLAKPALGALALLAGGVLAGMIVINQAGRTGLPERRAVPSPARQPVEGRDPHRGRWVFARVLAVCLGAVNVVALTTLTPLGAWAGAGQGRGSAAVALLALAFVVPFLGVWYAHRTERALR